MKRTRLLLALLILVFPIVQLRGIAQSPYKLGWETEVPVLTAGAATTLAGLFIRTGVVPLTVEEISALSPGDINSFDRAATSRYSIGAGNASDILVTVAGALPLAFLLEGRTRSEFGTIAAMYCETALFAIFLPQIAKGTVLRTRPYVYNPSVPMEPKQEPDARRSFFSGHSAYAFASAVFFSTVYCDFFPESRFKQLVWGGSLILAGTVGLLRFEAGSHFPTDILFGALVGSAIGYLVPTLHKRAEEEQPGVGVGPEVRQGGFSISVTIPL